MRKPVFGVSDLVKRQPGYSERFFIVRHLSMIVRKVFYELTNLCEFKVVLV